MNVIKIHFVPEHTVQRAVIVKKDHTEKKDISADVTHPRFHVFFFSMLRGFGISGKIMQ